MERGYYAPQSGRHVILRGAWNEVVIMERGCYAPQSGKHVIPRGAWNEVVRVLYTPQGGKHVIPRGAWNEAVNEAVSCLPDLAETSTVW